MTDSRIVKSQDGFEIRFQGVLGDTIELAISYDIDGETGRTVKTLRLGDSIVIGSETQLCVRTLPREGNER